MGAVTVSSSATRTALGIGARFSSHRSAVRKPVFLAFRTDKSRNSAFITPQESIPLPTDVPKEVEKRPTRASSKASKQVEASSSDGASTCTIDLDYNEAAAKLENIYKLSPTDVSDAEDLNHTPAKRLKTRKRTRDGNEKDELKGITLVRNHKRKLKRLTLEKRIALRQKKEQDEKADGLTCTKGNRGKSYDVNKLVREYSLVTDIVSLDWKRMKIPPVLPSSEHTWLFKLMQPMKELFLVKEGLHKDLGSEPSDGELGAATKMSVADVRRQIKVGLAARNKLIRHNLRLVLFLLNKYYQDIANDQKFQDLCQAGAKGLITAIDRFQPKRGFRLSTYGLFWIRHAIIRSTTVSSFMRVPFGIESVRQEIQKAKLELLFEHERQPTDEEIIEKVGISLERYQDVMRASKQVLSLNAKHMTTQEEFIDRIADIDGFGGDKRRQSALLRLALDDVLDSLKPKESLVMRQRYGMDGKGDRTLGEIAGNLNISREMVRKHEMKALMKLKHPARVDYLRRHIF